MENVALYIHWPYCRSKCPYCDFNSHVANGIDHEKWRAAYRREIEYYAALLPGRRVTSIFFGGGTPSLMESETVSLILGEIARHWSVADDVEITLEANPNSAEAQKFSDFRKAGVNRLSLGVQSLDDEALKFLGRAHDGNEARRAIEFAAQYFPRFSFDLIYARRGQTPAAWKAELQEALNLAGDHLSLYQLTIEPGTQFHTRDARGEHLTAPEDDAAAMYELTQDALSAAGLPAYEISNHAKPGNESRHNLAYWRYEDYVGIGPGAHGRFRRQITEDRRQKEIEQAELKGISVPCPPSSVFCLATENHRAPEVWLAQAMQQGNGLRLCDAIDPATAQREAVMMGLRVAEGINHAAWEKKFGAPLAGSALPMAKIVRLAEEGYLVNDTSCLKATAAGLQRLNAMLGYLL